MRPLRSFKDVPSFVVGNRPCPAISTSRGRVLSVGRSDQLGPWDALPGFSSVVQFPRRLLLREWEGSPSFVVAKGQFPSPGQFLFGGPTFQLGTLLVTPFIASLLWQSWLRNRAFPCRGFRPRRCEEPSCGSGPSGWQGCSSCLARRWGWLI